MENEFLSKVEDNAAVHAWSEKLQSERGDSLAEGYISELQDFTRVNIAQNELQELRDIWASWDDGVKQLFYQNYGDISYLVDIRVDKHLFRAIVQFWNSIHKCFTFGDVDLQKGDSKCIPWENLRDLILTHPDERKRVDIFTLSIYGLVIFPKALRYMDEAVIDLFDRLEKGITPVLAILAETFRSLSSCRKTGKGRFIGCAQLLMAWFHGHLWKIDKVSYRVFFEGYSPLKEEAAIQKREDISKEKWMDVLQNLKEGDIEWRAYWMVPDEIILAQSEFPFKGAHYKKKVRELSDAWKQTCWMKRLAVGFMVTPEYNKWFKKRVNDNVLRPSLENARPIGEQLQVAPSELEIIKQDFEKKSSELGKKIEQLEEEKIHLRLDADVQRSEAEKTAGLGKTSEQWRHKMREEKANTDRWEKKFREAQAQNEDLEKSLSESRNERGELRVRVAELKKTLHQYRNHNTAMELRASLS
ncbi:hypothetical protein CXB51_034076 [Gossypium anomalum]|uniref:DUF7745 domain-containing protein n=1 Tax=Gossypium anomalum TaxID=47600 RepID=A0A8J6CKL2_9ROSI|nr:hypothetical protein CXB51_034076 [Gossypium anomalum]